MHCHPKQTSSIIFPSRDSARTSWLGNSRWFLHGGLCLLWVIIQEVPGFVIYDDISEKVISDALMSSPLSLVQSSHHFFIIIFGKMYWQMWYIFKFWPRTVWQLPTEILTFCASIFTIRSQHLVPVSHCCCSTVLQAIYHAGHLLTIHSCPWTCGATQAPWTSKLFTIHHLKRLQCVFIISFLSSWKIVMLSHGLIQCFLPHTALSLGTSHQRV
jgi:hypothetical protein